MEKVHGNMESIFFKAEQVRGEIWHWTRLEKFANEFQRLQEVLHVFDLLIVTNSK